MLKFGDEKGQLKCSFCGKLQEQVKKLVAGPGVYICDECIELCNEIIEEELGDDMTWRCGIFPAQRKLKRFWINMSSARKTQSVRWLSRYTIITNALTSAIKLKRLSCRKAILSCLVPQAAVKHCWHRPWPNY